MKPSFVVTGGARGAGRAIAERLAGDGHVVVVDVEAGEAGHERIVTVVGDAGDPQIAQRAAAVAEAAGPLVGWVNNAAVFRDAGLSGAGAAEVLELVTANLRPAVTGCHTANGPDPEAA